MTNERTIKNFLIKIDYVRQFYKLFNLYLITKKNDFILICIL